MIVPVESDLTAPYWAAARRGQVLLQHCIGCAHTWHPPAPVCPRCRAGTWEWRPAVGRASLVSWTRVMHSVHGAVATEVPYLLGLVQLVEGPLFICGIVAPAGETGLADGSPLTIVLARAAGGEHLPMALPVGPVAPAATGPDQLA